MSEIKKISKKDATDELWRRGILIFKCHQVQREMYNRFYAASPNSTLVWLLSRQSGKSFLLGILALEHALKKPHSIVKLLTDTKLHVRSIFEKIFEELLRDCPETLKPKYYQATFTYQFPNGSAIQLAGSDNKHYEKLRGQKSVLVLVDEAGFCNNLEDAVKSVLIPTTTHTGGKIVLASTPPEDSEHDFFGFIEEAELNGNLVKKTIYENPLLDKVQIERIIQKMGGEFSDRFRREYKCELIKDASTVVIPEFTEELEKRVIKEWLKAPFYDAYVSMDLGGKDLTALLFGYFDFRADKVIIEDEIVIDFRLPENTLPKLIKLIKEKEAELWTNKLTQEIKKPYLRVSDINYIVTQEISRASNNEINFIIPKKDDKEMAINNLRVMLNSEKIIINPKCTTLIRHLKHVKWSSKINKTQFARSSDNGHYDCVDALVYMIRTMIFGKNPYPAHYGVNTKDLYVHNPQQYNQNTQINMYKRIFNIKDRKRI